MDSVTRKVGGQIQAKNKLSLIFVKLYTDESLFMEFKSAGIFQCLVQFQSQKEKNGFQIIFNSAHTFLAIFFEKLYNFFEQV